MTTPEQENTPPVQHEDGIYFSLPMDRYRADPALGSGDLCRLNESPIAYWRQSHMNPKRALEESDDDQSLGSAFHCRILEGPEVFSARYIAKLDRAAMPDVPDTAKELQAYAARLGIKGARGGAPSGTKPELCALIREKEPGFLSWDDVETAHGKKHAGKTFLKPETIAKIEDTAAIVAAHPHASKALTGGYPEVSIFWHDPETDVRCKARIDYLKPRVMVDLKSFANKMGEPIERAVIRAMSRWGYLTQAVHYAEGLEMVKHLARNEAAKMWIHIPNPELTADNVEHASREHLAAQAFLRQLIASAPHQFLFVFLESCDFPSIRVKECAREIQPQGASEPIRTEYWRTGQKRVRAALDTYKACMAAFGPNRPWLDVAPLTAFADEDLINAQG